MDAAEQLRLFELAVDQIATISARRRSRANVMALKEQLRELRHGIIRMEKTRDELTWEIATLGEALEAVIETHPIHSRKNEVKKFCREWPNCNHACGEGLHRAHGIALKALEDAFGKKWADKLRARQVELSTTDEEDDTAAED